MGRIFDIQPFSLHDGPGTRTTVFFQGCPMRCKWCHNPESQPRVGAILFFSKSCVSCGACAEACRFGGKTARHTRECALCGECAEACYAGAIKLSGYEISAEDLALECLRDFDTYARSGGGVTFSGGEPFYQPAFLRETLEILKSNGVHTAVESSMCARWEDISSALPYIDLLYADIKCASPELHISGTGVSNAHILENISRAADAGANMVLRTPIVPGFNADEREIARVAEFARALRGSPPIEFMAYHGMCAGKYAALGRRFEMEGVPEPGEDIMKRLSALAGAKYSM